MTKETIEQILNKIKDLELQKSSIESQIIFLKEDLLPFSYEIEQKLTNLEHLGHFSNYYFISKNNKVIGQNWKTKVDAILDAWNHSRIIYNNYIKNNPLYE